MTSPEAPPKNWRPDTVGAPYRDADTSGEVAPPLLTWCRVPGNLSAWAMALSTGVFLALVAAVIHRVAPAVAGATPGAPRLVDLPSSLYFVSAVVLLIGFPLILPAMFRLASRRLGRGRVSLHATGGACFDANRPIALYRADLRAFGCDRAAIARATKSPDANLYLAGVLRVPLPTWLDVLALYSVLVLVATAMLPFTSNPDIGGIAVLMAPIAILHIPLSILSFQRFDCWTVNGWPGSRNHKFRSWIEWWPGVRTTIERATKVTQARCAAWQRWDPRQGILR